MGMKNNSKFNEEIREIFLAECEQLRATAPKWLPPTLAAKTDKNEEFWKDVELFANRVSEDYLVDLQTAVRVCATAHECVAAQQAAIVAGFMDCSRELVQYIDHLNAKAEEMYTLCDTGGACSRALCFAEPANEEMLDALRALRMNGYSLTLLQIGKNTVRLIEKDADGDC